MNTNETALILEAEQHLLTALKTSNLEQLESLLHNDLLFVIPTGQTVTKAMDMANIRSEQLKIESIQADQHQIQSFGDTAIVIVNVHLKGQFLDQVIDSDFKYFRTWKRFNNNWKVIGGAAMQV